MLTTKAQTSSDNLPSYLPDNHHSSDVVLSDEILLCSKKSVHYTASMHRLDMYKQLQV